MPQPVEMPIARKLPAGDYWIGNDSTPNASPRHMRRFIGDVWIDQDLLSWRAFEAFVTSGGYADSLWWRAADGNPFSDSAQPASVDNRCETIRQMTLADAPVSWQLPRGDLPALGLTWFEAAAVCHFSGARLPFEAEWETAMAAGLLQRANPALSAAAQEWCFDGYASRYWRADSGVRGRSWHAGQKVTVRGYRSTEPTLGLTARRPADPSSGNAGCGFRRVWERAPSA